MRRPWLLSIGAARRSERRPIGGSLTDRRRLAVEQLEDRRVLSITVDTLADENDGAGVGTGTSLREAIAAAIAGDTIEFSVAGTIELTLPGILTINKSLTIDGPGADLLTIRAYDPTPTQNNGDGRSVLTISDGNANSLSNVFVSGLTITGGDTRNLAGGIFTAENLEMTQCVISDNNSLAPGYDSGGGIFSYNTASLPNSLTIRNSIIDGNSLPNGEGGGIRKRYGTLIIEDSTISNNIAHIAGGGISAADGNVNIQIRRSMLIDNHQTGGGGGGGLFALFSTVTIADSTISGNTAFRGGGISAPGSTLTVTDTSVSGNEATTTGGGIGFDGYEMSLLRCAIAGNSAGTFGGGMHFAGYSLTVTETTVNGNMAVDGGGSWIQRDATIVNSTLSGNTADNRGGAIYTSQGHTVLRFTTITANTADSSKGGGIWCNIGSTSTTSRVQLLSTIVAGNTDEDLHGVSGGLSFASLGYNLVGTGFGISDFSTANGDLIGIAPMLGPLADNGGPTMTHSPLADSPAIDTGNPTAVAGMVGVPLDDQRGEPFTRVFDSDGTAGARIDIGAFELQRLPAAFFGDYNGDGSVDVADYVLWRTTLGTTGVPAYSGADGDGDTMIDQDDYDVWTEHFGEMLPPGGGSGAGQQQLAPDSMFSRDAERSAAAVRGQETRAQQPGAEETRHPEGTRDCGLPMAGGVAANRPMAAAMLPPALESAASLHDDALVAWLTSRTVVEHEHDRGEVAHRKDLTATQAKHDTSNNSLDAVFELLAL
jgi:CSLREA domain-containing protein